MNKPKKRTNVISPFKSELNQIDHIFAKDGQIWIFLKNGRQRMLRIKDAAMRAKALNAMIPKLLPDMRKNHLELVEKIIKVIKEAKYQRENMSHNKKTKLLLNVLDGKDEKGNSISESFSEESNMQYYKLKYGQLAEDDVIAILRNKDLDDTRKEQLLSEMQRIKLSEISKEVILASS